MTFIQFLLLLLRKAKGSSL